MELELKHLAPYLLYGLKIKNSINKIVELTLSDAPYHFKKGFQPILRPLSDLTKAQLKHLDIHSKLRLSHNIKYGTIYLLQYEWLLKNHFDVFGLIEKGLAINKNTL